MSSKDLPLSNRILPPLCSLAFEPAPPNNSTPASKYEYFPNNQSSYSAQVSNQSYEPYKFGHGSSISKSSQAETSFSTNKSASSRLSNPRLTNDPYQSEASTSTSSHDTIIERYQSLSPPAEGSSAQHILAEKRRRNAGASARFRDRRKQREQEILERCVLLEDKVRELEHANPFTHQLAELSMELKHAQLEKENAIEKLKVLENEVAWLRELIISKGETLPPYTIHNMNTKYS
ncbi:hypothetical protein K7432_006455 [Basidiobolus ranarum]|uniref:BZIP domain-containing protein n=1 Tax=Basidiobolus ranarum TaxID=34480 RepID=A0ABR2W1T4_9FUNG